MKKNKLESVEIKLVADDSPDTSFLGEYTDSPDPWAIVRCEGEYLENLGDDYELPSKGRVCRFFKPYAGGEKPGSKEYQEYGKQDFKRMEQLNDGEFSFIGIRACANVSYSTGQENRRLDILESGGLWGIESDSGHDYLEQIAREQLDDLKQHLQQFNVATKGFGKLAESAIDNADI